MAPLFHGACGNHEMYGLTCEDYTALRRDHDDQCRLCCSRHPWMNIDHEHPLGMRAVRGLLCPRCNAGHMRRVDWGERAIDDRTRDYLMNPWYLRQRNLAASYDPRVSISAVTLNAADQVELSRLVTMPVITPHSVRKARPNFLHPGIAACLVAHDVRPILRLIWMVDRGWLSTDIAALIAPKPRWCQ